MDKIKIKDKVKKIFTHTRKVLKGEKALNKNYSTSKIYGTEEEAHSVFEMRKKQFLNISEWDKLSGPENASFTLFDKDGNKSENKIAKKGYYIKVDLPGPLPIYWVIVEDVAVEKDLVMITLRPSIDPTDHSVDNSTKHFFKSNALNILKLVRRGKELCAEEIGKMESINNNTPEAGNFGTINTLVASGGWAGIQAHQWNAFTKNLVSPNY